MNLIFNKSEFEHVKRMSFYNNNYYRHKKLDYLIYEICYEDENYYDFFLVENGENIFIGSSEILAGDEADIKIEFKNFFT